MEVIILISPNVFFTSHERSVGCVGQLQLRIKTSHRLYSSIPSTLYEMQSFVFVSPINAKTSFIPRGGNPEVSHNVSFTTSSAPGLGQYVAQCYLKRGSMSSGERTQAVKEPLRRDFQWNDPSELLLLGGQRGSIDAGGGGYES